MQAQRDISHVLFAKRLQALFVVLDGAQSDDVLNVVYEYSNRCMCEAVQPPQFRSLYSGAAERDLGQFGPVLISLTDHPILVRELLEKGWGHAWGFYCESHSTFEALRQHLRKLLSISLPNGESVYFRFYDPRVLGIYLATASANTKKLLLGPMKAIVYEAQGGDAVATVTHDSIVIQMVPQ